MKFSTVLFASATAAPTPGQATPLSIGSRRINGNDARDDQFPCQVTLQDLSGFHYCGGSILAPTKVQIIGPIIQRGSNLDAIVRRKKNIFR